MFPSPTQMSGKHNGPVDHCEDPAVQQTIPSFSFSPVQHQGHGPGFNLHRPDGVVALSFLPGVVLVVVDRPIASGSGACAMVRSHARSRARQSIPHITFKYNHRTCRIGICGHPIYQLERSSPQASPVGRLAGQGCDHRFIGSASLECL